MVRKGSRVQASVAAPYEYTEIAPSWGYFAFFVDSAWLLLEALLVVFVFVEA